MSENAFPFISLMLMTLPVGAILIWLVPNPNAARWIALLTAIVDLLLALAIVFNFDPAATGFQFIERHAWMPALNIQYLVGIDGVSVLFLPLTVLLFIGVILSGWTSSRRMVRLYYTLLLVLESTTLGVFCALDTILFFLFWELTLLPLYFLISLWGIGAHRRYAAVKYTLFMMVGGIPLLFGFIQIAFHHAQLSNTGIPDGLVFDYLTLFSQTLPVELQTGVFFLLLLGFAAKVPVFPLHTWLPTVAMEGPVSVAAIMTGMKLGAYGFIRFVIPLAPQAAMDFSWLLAGLGVAGIIYGALLAMGQTNLRRMLAYASISHVGLLVLGLAAFNLQGIQGAVFQLLNFTLISGGLFLLTGFLYQRTGTTDHVSLGGLVNRMPLLTAFFFMFGLAALGVPGTNGFPAELLLLLGILKANTGAGLAALSVLVLAAAYFMNLYRKVFLGPVTSSIVADTVDLNRRELLLITPLMLLILVIGLKPDIVTDMVSVSSEDWIAHLTPK